MASKTMMKLVYALFSGSFLGRYNSYNNHKQVFINDPYG